MLGTSLALFSFVVAFLLGCWLVLHRGTNVADAAGVSSVQILNEARQALNIASTATIKPAATLKIVVS